MGSSVRAKFKVESINDIEGTAQVNIMLRAVTSGSPENDEFFKYTPSGEVRLNVVNPTASGMFEVGKEYYLDFTPAN